MPKPFKALLEPETVANKVHDSSKMEGKKPATDNIELESSITPTEILKIGSRYLIKSYNYLKKKFNLRPSVNIQETSREKTLSSFSMEDSNLIKNMMSRSNPEEVTEAANKMLNKYCFNEALMLYDRALELSPNDATYHTNRAAALPSLSRVGEAVIECEEALELESNLARANTILATLLLRLGHVSDARKHYFAVIEPSDLMVVKVVEQIEKHLNRCTDARRCGEWNIVLREVNAAMASGADWSPLLAMCKVEALLKLLRIDEAQTALECVPNLEPFPLSFSHTRFFDMKFKAYTYYVTSLMELALGRFENAITVVEKAIEIDPRSSEVEKLYGNVILITRQRDRGNDLYESERYSEAIKVFEECLNKFDPYNATLFSQKADCFFKLGMWEKSIEDCNRSLAIQPNSIEPLRKRAMSYFKLERWAEAIRDYDTLRKLLHLDTEMADSLIHALFELEKSCREVEEISSLENKEFGVQVEEIFSLQQLQSALSRHRISIVLYMRACDKKCQEMSIFMDELCKSYRDMHFLKVEIEESPVVGEAEKVKSVPTFKSYFHGNQIEELVCPSKEAVETLVRQLYVQARKQ